MIQVQCPVCSTTYRLKAGFENRKLRCNGCGEKFRVPGPDGIAASSAPTAGRSVAEFAEDRDTDFPAGEPGAGTLDRIAARCPNCDSGYLLKPKYAGMTVRCKACRTHFDVPIRQGGVPAAESASAWSGSRIDIALRPEPAEERRLPDDANPEDEDLQTVSIDLKELEKLRAELSASKQERSIPADRIPKRVPAGMAAPTPLPTRTKTDVAESGRSGGGTAGKPRTGSRVRERLPQPDEPEVIDVDVSVFEAGYDGEDWRPGPAEPVLPEGRRLQATLGRHHGAAWFMCRGLLAIGLTLAFYGLAFGLAFSLLAVLYLTWQQTGRINGKMAAFCVGSSGCLLWALIPRRESFEPPGPELNPEEEPAIYAMIADVAESTGQRMPDEVYLLMEANAWVAEYGGILGFGRKRVLALGLPLMVGVNEAELRGVIAHEFGHFAGNDTLVGPWLYASYMSLMRSIVRFEKSWLQYPFVLYARLYFRVIHAVKREQEYQADAVAVSVVGPLPMKTGLLKLVSLDYSFMDYMQNYVVPALHSGQRVAILQGFARYSKSESHIAISDQVRKFEKELRTQPYDTHPSLRERLAAIDQLESWGNLNAPAPALSKLNKPQAYEIRALFADYDARKYAVRDFLPWSRFYETIKIPAVRSSIDNHFESIGQFTIEEVPYFFSRPKAYLDELALEAEVHDELMREIVDMMRTPDHESGVWAVVVSPVIHAVSLALYRQGWKVDSNPGDGWILSDPSNASRVVRVQDLVCRLFFTMRGDRKMPLDKPRVTPSEWMESMRRHGIADVPLSQAWEVPLPAEAPPPDDFAIDLTGA